MKDLLIRDVPSEVIDWIQEERESRLLTQNELLLEVLDDAYRSSTQLNLFSTNQRVVRVPEALPFTFSDFFAGIGGLRLGLERVGGKCVFSSEYDRWAQKTYSAWFGEVPHGDIHDINPSDIPYHDILAAGFPCQPFSIAGVSKKKSLGRKHGFDDLAQGNLFFTLARIINLVRPPVLLLENVKNLRSHDKGRTWDVIEATLRELGYTVFSKVIDAAGWVPQHRERIFIVCFDREIFGDWVDFQFPDEPPRDAIKLREILEKKVDDRYTLSDHLWQYLQEYAEKHRRKGNGFGFGIGDPNGTTRTLSARYYKDGSEILIAQRRKNPRRLTPRECARLMGYPDTLNIVVSDTQAYKQFGNSVVPPLIEAIARQIITVLSEHLRNEGALIKRREQEAYPIAVAE